MQAWHDARKTRACGREEDDSRGQVCVRQAVDLALEVSKESKLQLSLIRLERRTGMAEEENEGEVAPDARVFLVVNFPMESYPKGDISAIFQ